MSGKDILGVAGWAVACAILGALIAYNGWIF